MELKKNQSIPKIEEKLPLEKLALQQLIERAGLTQRQVAEALGITSQTVNNWLRGRHQNEPIKLSIKQIKILC